MSSERALTGDAVFNMALDEVAGLKADIEALETSVMSHAVGEIASAIIGELLKGDK